MININRGKTNEGEVNRDDVNALLDNMSNAVDEICNVLSKTSKNFNEVHAFEIILDYIVDYKRLLYSNISNYIFKCQSEEQFTTFQTNIDNVLKYVYSNDFKKRIPTKNHTQDDLERAKGAVLKIYDHVNLAKRQFTELKDSEEDYKRKFKSNIEPLKHDLTRDMSGQLITLVGIFTALAFLVFGGISSLDNIFAKVETIPVQKLIIVGSIWGLCILNLVFVFLFCVGKMTKLNYKSTDDENANLIQKYPIVWWSNLIIITILLMSTWVYYIDEKNIGQWFNNWSIGHQKYASVGGLVVIGLIFIIGTMTIFVSSKPCVRKDRAFARLDKGIKRLGKNKVRKSSEPLKEVAASSNKESR